MARRPENQEVLKRNFSTNKTQSGRLTYGKQRAGSTTALAAAAAAPTRVPTQLNLMDGNGGLFPQHSTKQNNLWKTSICKIYIRSQDMRRLQRADKPDEDESSDEDDENPVCAECRQSAKTSQGFMVWVLAVLVVLV